MKKIFFASLLILFTLPLLHAQTNNTVVLTVSGSGKTQEEADKNSLKAIDSAFDIEYGYFVDNRDLIPNDPDIIYPFTTKNNLNP
jgi:hypothetical protein